MTTRRLFNENVKLMIKSKKIKNRLTINNSLIKNIVFSTYVVLRTFDVLMHNLRIIDVSTVNQQKIIRRIKKQNETLHSRLRITLVIWSKSVNNNEKELFSLIVKIYNAKQINRLIKNDLLHEYSYVTCELFVNNSRIKQCFYCQRYDHINKICKYEKRCSICSTSYNKATCKISNAKKKCVNCEENHSTWFFLMQDENCWENENFRHITHEIDFALNDHEEHTSNNFSRTRDCTAIDVH
jgi:hypothetical protein